MTSCQVEIIDRDQKNSDDSLGVLFENKQEDLKGYQENFKFKLRSDNENEYLNQCDVQKKHQIMVSHIKQHKNLDCIPYYSSRLSTLLFTLILLSLPSLTQSYTLTISSSQPYTGVAASYYFTLQSHNNPTNLVFTFTTWSPNLVQPFTTSYQIIDNSTGNVLSCIKRFTLTIQCNMSASTFIGGSYPSTIILKMTNIFNPSSLKPYPISVYINSSLSTQNQTSNLTIFLPRPQQIYIDSYSSTIGQMSSSLLYLNFKNYLTSTTVLTLTYNSSLVTINMLNDSSYTIGTDIAGTKKLTGWNPATQILKTLKINITNPSVAVQFTIQGMLTFTQNGTDYQIESYSIIIQPTALAYTSIGTSSLATGNKLFMGSTLNSLSLYAQCSLATINSPTKNSYFQITYDNTLITVQNTSNCLASTVNSTLSSCTINITLNTALANNTFSWTDVYSMIPTTSILTNVSLKIRSWSYFSPMAQFYSVCESTITVNVVPQVIAPTVGLTSCVNSVGAQNTLTVNFAIMSSVVGDTIVIKSFIGKVMNKTGSLPVTYNATLQQYESPVTSSLLTNSTNIQFNITFTNPTFIPTNQPLININLYRKLSSNTSLFNTYGQTSLALNLCPVTIQKSSSNCLLTLSGSATYQTGIIYYIEVKSGAIQLNDYAVNDYLIVNFKIKVSNSTAFAITDSPFQLSSYTSGTPIVNLNSQYLLPTSIISSSSLQITLNSTSIINLINNQGVSSLFLAIKSLSNPYFAADVYCQINTYTSTGLLKETITTSSVSLIISANTQLSISSTSIITSLQTNNTITLEISSHSNKTLLSSTSYSFITLFYIVVKMPFSCSNTNGTNQIITTLPSLNTTKISVRLTQCQVAYFQDYTQSIQVSEFVRFTQSNLTINYLLTTTSSYAIKSTCGDQCHLCDTTTLKCIQCFNSSYNLFNYIYPSSGKCYQTCPIKTFGNGFTCQDCHQICQTCLNSLYSSCTQCAANFVMNSMGICESTCGSSMYLSDDGVCQSCDPNCSGCMNQTYCYSCQSGAVMIDNMCVFSQCRSPCATCSGSMDYCLTCINFNSTEYYFYQNKCYSQCPSDTFKWDISVGATQKICKKVQSANVYFLGIVLCAIAFGIGLGIRCFAPKKTKLSSSLDNSNNNDGNNQLLKTTKLQRKLSETFNHDNKNLSKVNNLSLTQPSVPFSSSLSRYRLYKLNLLRFMTVLMGYIEVICAVVILIQGGMYNPKGVNELIVVGLVGLVVTNFIFGFKYYRSVYKKLMQKRQKFIQANLSFSNSNKKEDNEKEDNKPQQIQPPIIQPKQINVQQIVVQNNNLTPNQDQISKKLSSHRENIQNLPQQQQQKQQKSQQLSNKINITNNQNEKKINQQTLINNRKLLYSQYSMNSEYNFEDMSEQQRQRMKQNKRKLAQFDNQMMRELLVAVLSTVFTLRTYNILRSNLFVLFGQQLGNKGENEKDNVQVVSKMGRKVSNSFNTMSYNIEEQVMGSHSALKLPHQLQQKSNQPEKRLNQPEQLKNTQPMMLPKKQSTNKLPILSKKSTLKEKNSTNSVIKVQSQRDKGNKVTKINNLSQRSNNNNNNNNSTNRNNNSKQSQSQSLRQQHISQNNNNISPIQPLALIQDVINTIKYEPNPLLVCKNQLRCQFYHPFYTYLMFSSLFLVSLMFGISSAILVFKNRYQNMMLWGIDALIIISINFILNIFDLWKVVNLKDLHQQSQSQITSTKQKQKHNIINQTLQNLKDTQLFNQFDNNNDKRFTNMDGLLVQTINNNDMQINDLNITKKLSSYQQSTNKKSFSPLKIASKSKINDMTKNNEMGKFNNNNKNDLSNKIKNTNDMNLTLNINEKSLSPKSPSLSMKSDKTKIINSKNKRSLRKNIDSTQQYIDQQPPQLKIFDDLGIEDDYDNQSNNNKGLSREKQLSMTKMSSLSKVKSQNRSIKGRKTQMSNNLQLTIRGNNNLQLTTRGNNNYSNLKLGNNAKNYKLDDIYLGFLQPQTQNPTNTIISYQQNINPLTDNIKPLAHNSNQQQQQEQIEQIQTVKLSQTNQILIPQNNKQQSKVNIINSDQQEYQKQQENKNRLKNDNNSRDRQTKFNKLQIIQRNQNNSSLNGEEFVQ